MDVFDKYSQEKIGSIEFDTEEIIENKIAKAVRRFTTAKSSTFKERGHWLYVIENILKTHKETLSQLICQEAGKPLFYAENELDRCIDTVHLGSQYFDVLSTQTVPVNFKDTPHHNATTKRFPIGVIFGIAPFNFPLNLALHKIVPAIASGNCIVIKPSPYTPLSLDFFLKKINEQLPEGLVQIIHCENEQAEKIVKDARIKMVSFTGSAAIGWHIKSLIPKKKVTLELGGNAAVYIDQNTDLSKIAKKVATGAYLYAGQICISTQRIFVHENCYTDFKSLLITEIEQLKSGNPNGNVTNGPLIDEVHLKRIDTWVQESKEQGASILTGGMILDNEKNIYAPTLIEHVQKGMKVYDEEVFGPVATISKVNDYQDAILQINDSKYGLQVGVFSTDDKVIHAFFEEIDAGGIIANNIPGFRKDEMPYGGIKDSGFGREGIKYAMEDMTELKLLIQ